MPSQLPSLLVFGYIRQIQSTMIDTVIPLEICQLCLNYYPSARKIILIHGRTIKIADISKQSVVSYQIEVDGRRGRQWDWYYWRSQLCLAKNVENKYDILFSGTGFGQLLPDVDNSGDTNIMRTIEMPMQHILGANLLFSQKYGLLRINQGFNNAFHFNTNKSTIHHLSFDGINYQQLFENKTNILLFENGKFQWKLMGHLKRPRLYASATIIKCNDNEEKLFVVGGYDGHDWGRRRGSVEILSFMPNNTTYHEYDKCHNINIPRCNAGIMFDVWSKNVFIGGGSSPKWRKYWQQPQQSIERFDLIKMRSYHRYPFTKHEYFRNAVLWKDDKNYNILNIACDKNDEIEFIDLRQANKGWYVKDIKLSQLFQLEQMPTSSRLFL